MVENQGMNPEETLDEKDDVLADLDELDRAIIRWTREEPGIKAEELARRIGVHGNTIRRRLKKEKLKYALLQLTKGALEMILENQIKITRTALKHLDDSDSMISLRASLGLLNKIVADKREIEGHFDANITVVASEDFLPGPGDKEDE